MSARVRLFYVDLTKIATVRRMCPAYMKDVYVRVCVCVCVCMYVCMYDCLTPVGVLTGDTWGGSYLLLFIYFCRIVPIFNIHFYVQERFFDKIEYACMQETMFN